MHKTTILVSTIILLQALSTSASADEDDSQVSNASRRFAHSGPRETGGLSRLSTDDRTVPGNEYTSAPAAAADGPRNEHLPSLVRGLSSMLGTPPQEYQTIPADYTTVSGASQPVQMPQSGVLYSSQTKSAPLPGTITGIVYTIPRVRASTGYKVVMPGTPLSAAVAPDGTFTLYRVPPWGKWDLQVVPETGRDELVNSTRSFPISFAAGDGVTLYDIVLYDPGSISGAITGLSPEQLAQCVVTVDNGRGSLVAAKPDSHGGFLLQGVAPGQREAKLQAPTGASLPVISRRVRLFVHSGEVVLGCNFGPLSTVRPVDADPVIPPLPSRIPLLPVRGNPLFRQ